LLLRLATSSSVVEKPGEDGGGGGFTAVWVEGCTAANRRPEYQKSRECNLEPSPPVNGKIERKREARDWLLLREFGRD